MATSIIAPSEEIITPPNNTSLIFSPVSSWIKSNPSASAELNPSICTNLEVIKNSPIAKNIPTKVDKIAEKVFPDCPFNKSKVTVVDKKAHKMLDAIGNHPENTAGRRNSIIRNMEYRRPAIDFNPFLPPIQKIAAISTIAQDKSEKERS